MIPGAVLAAALTAPAFQVSGPAHALLDVGGARLFCESIGAGSALVFLHDEATDRRVWDRVWSGLSRGRRVLRYDRRGAGRSPGPPAPSSDVEDLRRLLDALGISRASLAGLAAGGGLAVDFAARNPGRVEALLLVNPSRTPGAARLARLKAPTLVVVGERVAAATHSRARLIGARVAGAKVVVVPEAGDLLPLEQPSALKRVFLEFLGRGGP